MSIIVSEWLIYLLSIIAKNVKSKNCTKWNVEGGDGPKGTGRACQIAMRGRARMA
jgi:hypothetical protein